MCAPQSVPYVPQSPGSAPSLTAVGKVALSVRRPQVSGMGKLCARPSMSHGRGRVTESQHLHASDLRSAQVQRATSQHTGTHTPVQLSSGSYVTPQSVRATKMRVVRLSFSLVAGLLWSLCPHQLPYIITAAETRIQHEAASVLVCTSESDTGEKRLRIRY